MGMAADGITPPGLAVAARAPSVMLSRLTTDIWRRAAIFITELPGQEQKHDAS